MTCEGLFSRWNIPTLSLNPQPYAIFFFILMFSLSSLLGFIWWKFRLVLMTACCGHWTTEAMCTCAPASLRRCLLGLPGNTFLVCLQRHSTSPGISGSLPHIDSGSLMPAYYIQCPANWNTWKRRPVSTCIKMDISDPIQSGIVVLHNIIHSFY